MHSSCGTSTCSCSPGASVGGIGSMVTSSYLHMSLVTVSLLRTSLLRSEVSNLTFRNLSFVPEISGVLPQHQGVHAHHGTHPFLHLYRCIPAFLASLWLCA